MKSFLQPLTDRVATKKGMWITLAIWVAAIAALALFAPSAKDYEVTTIDSLPEDAQSVIAKNKVDEYFPNDDGMPSILVFEAKEGEIELAELSSLTSGINENIEGIDEMVPFWNLPPQATAGFISEDGTTAIIPLNLEPGFDSKDIQTINHSIEDYVKENSGLNLYITGPAGIAVDSLELFSNADLRLLFATVGLILVLLIAIYRSPLLALIPLFAAGFVYLAVMQILGLLGMGGLEISNQTVSIMSILLFAAVIDYSLFVFSRFKEELKEHEDKFEAMRTTMREVGLPVFFSGGTVLAAMLVLFFAEFGEYRNFAPTFATAMGVIMLASITLVPALFVLFGRKSFWPKIPKVGDERASSNSFWSKVGRSVVKKPGLSSVLVVLLLIIGASNIFNLEYEFNTMNSFPADTPSRAGYNLLEEKFEKGDLAPTTVIFEGDSALSEDKIESLRAELAERELVSNVRLNGVSEDGKAINYSLTFDESPYSVEAMDSLEVIVEEADDILSESGTEGSLYFAGETAKQVDTRSVGDRDLLLIVLLETILILVMLFVMTKSIKMPIYMMGTILVSFLAALGIGIFLTDLFFDIPTISSRVPLYSFVFLVALGIDYNIMLISRFQEERLKHPVKEAVQIAVANTGGVISSAGIILAATFAVLMTMPIELLFVFGFIVAVGIILDTFLIRGVLLPALIILFEKDKQPQGGK